MGAGASIPVFNSPTSVRQLLELYFGTPLRILPRESTPTVTTTAKQIDAWANVRTAVSVCNLGTVNVTVGFAAATLATAGFVLPPSQTVTFNWYLDNELVMYPLWAVALSGTQQLYVVESVLSGA